MIETYWSCLELTRTVGWQERDRPDDRLTDYGELLGWSVEAGVLDEAAVVRLRKAAGTRPSAAERVLERVHALRHLFYRIFSRIGAGEKPPATDLDELNAVLPQANQWLRIRWSDGRCHWDWPKQEAAALDRMLWPLIRSAAELLTSASLERLKLCDAHDCGWLFVDASRNRSRRWCDMSDCGNRAKARRHRQRIKAEPKAGRPSGRQVGARS